MSTSIVMSRNTVRRAILHALERLPTSASKEPLHLHSVAADLHCSPSTVQRRLAQLGTTYTAELNLMQSVVAVKLILRGDSASQAARAVGLTPDHLRHVLRVHAGLAPAALVRCRDIDSRLRHWTQHPASAGTRLYRRRLADWIRYRRELRLHLEDLPARTFLSPWASDLLARSRRPDFRSARYRAISHSQRARERAQRQATFEAALHTLLDASPRTVTSRSPEQTPISASAIRIKT
jgi:AraC-like DNA-binding protein